MNRFVKASITTKSAARLLLTNDINLEMPISAMESYAILDELLGMSYEEILGIIDAAVDSTSASVASIPQFGNVEALSSVPSILCKSANNSINYLQLGLLLKGDPSAKYGANMKFGENHGKGAVSLGLAIPSNDAISSSAITAAFCEYSKDDKINLIRKLYFRIPIFQIIMKNAKDNPFNGYSPMLNMAESTMIRRGQCLRSMIKDLKILNIDCLNRRFMNIYWEV